MGALGVVTLLVVLLVTAAQTRCDESAEDSVSQYLDDQEDCIQTPSEYVAAFKARQPRCVSDDLVGRVSSGATLATAKLSDATTRLSYFFSGSDVLAKYLRIGYPEILGLSTVGNASGLTTGSSGLAFLQQVGYQPEYADVSKVYVLTVASRTALENAAGALQDGLPYGGGVPPLPPTWAALQSYFEFVFSDFNLTLSQDALQILQNSSFAALTGCPANCAYQDSAFPSAGHTTPVVVAARSATGSCPAPLAATTPEVSSGLDASSQLCSADWLNATAAAAALFPERSCSTAQNVAAGATLAQLLAAAAADSPRYEAQLFRAFLLQYCAGGYYTLFSGDGFTYSSSGGLLAPLGTELVSSPFLAGALKPEEAASIPLCITGANAGQPDAAGTCGLPTTAGTAASSSSGGGGGVDSSTAAAARKLLRLQRNA